MNGDIRREIIVLSKITNWPLADILEFEEQEFYEWHKTAIVVQNDMNGL